MTWIGPVIELTVTDIRDALDIGLARGRDSYMRELDANCSKPDRKASERVGDDFVGCLGEIAVCRYMGKKWNRSVHQDNPDKEKQKEDVPGVGDVKAAWNPNARLIYRGLAGRDPKNRWYTLVTVNRFVLPMLATVVGCIKGTEVWRHEEWIDNPHGKAPAHFVPRSALKRARPRRYPQETAEHARSDGGDLDSPW